jgi:hypothetical protein
LQQVQKVLTVLGLVQSFWRAQSRQLRRRPKRYRR